MTVGYTPRTQCKRPGVLQLLQAVLFAAVAGTTTLLVTLAGIWAILLPVSDGPPSAVAVLLLSATACLLTAAATWGAWRLAHSVL